MLFDSLGLFAERLENVANSDPPTMRIVYDSPIYAPYERSAEEVNIVGGIRSFA